MPRRSDSRRSRGLRFVSAAATLVIVAGCESSGPSRVERVETPLESPEGTLNFGVLGEPATLDPYASGASDLTASLARPVYRSLYRWTPQVRPVPDLARSLSPTEGGAIIRLRPARFSDGKRITAQDVEASLTRAIESGHLIGIDRAVARGTDSVKVFGAPSTQWTRRLADASFVFPGGRFRPNLASGPFRISDMVSGLQLTYRPNPKWEGDAPRLRRLVVYYVDDLDLMMDLLERGRLDAAAPPITVNLQDRLRERGLASAAAAGDERIYLDLEGTDLTTDERTYIADSIDRSAIEEGFVRDNGAVDGGGVAGQGVKPDTGLELATPVGDELLVLTQRVIQKQLKAKGLAVDLVATEPRTFYSEWANTDPFDLAVRRGIGPVTRPDDSELRRLDAFPLFRVKSIVAWRNGIRGLVPNPTADGPLWNAQEWWAETG